MLWLLFFPIVAPKNAESRSADPVNQSIEMQNANIYSLCQPAGLLHDTIPLHHQNRAESGLMVSLILWDISFKERQERVGIGSSGSDVAGVSGGSGSGNGLGRVVLGEF